MVHMSFKKQPFIILLLLFLISWMYCNKVESITGSQEIDFVPIESGYLPKAKICTWKNNKKAALTIAFDDARQSHYQIAGIELKSRAMVGTFYLNTKNIHDWTPWQNLFNEGNEIASHTWSHCKSTELTEPNLHFEIMMAKQQILSNVYGIKDVPSFAYPYGDHNESVRSIVMAYHESARGDWGINDSSLSDEEFGMLKGIGVYAQNEPALLNDFLSETITRKGWMITYFHSVNKDEQATEESIPLSLFRVILDSIQSVQDSLWIGTQGQIVSYMKLRDSSQLMNRVVNKDLIEINLQGNFSSILRRSELSFIINLPSNWAGSTLILSYKNKKIIDICFEAKDTLIYNIIPGDILTIYGV